MKSRESIGADEKPGVAVISASICANRERSHMIRRQCVVIFGTNGIIAIWQPLVPNDKILIISAISTDDVHSHYQHGVNCKID